MPRKKNNEMETFDIKDRVIFSAGTHNGDLYTKADIKQIADAFYKCKGKLRPPLKLGHNEIQNFWQMDGMPAIGWVDNVRAVGSDLVADLVKIPRAIYELIEAGAYRTTSAEIYWNVVVEGEKYPYALKALSLLGADIPAVKSVSDLLALYNEKFAAAYAESNEFEVKTYEGATPAKENSMPDEKTPEQIAAETAAAEAAKVEADKAAVEAATKAEAEKAKPDPLATVVEKLETLVATLTEKKAKHEAKIAELSEKLTAAEKSYTEAKSKCDKYEADKKYADLESKVDTLIATKKMMPAQKPLVMKLLTEVPLGKSYKDGDTDKSIEELIFNILDGNTIKLHTEQKTEAGSESALDEVGQINKISKDKGISYKEAYKLWKQKGNPA
jgi:hypothetical protein